MNRTIGWFRRALRVSDHEPLLRAAGRGLVVPVFVFDRALLHHPETGSARVAFLLAALHALDADLKALGGRLIVRSGDKAARQRRVKLLEAQRDPAICCLTWRRCRKI